MTERPQWQHGVAAIVAAGCTIALAGLLLPFASAGLVRNSALLAAGVCAISLPVGSVLGLMLGRTNLPGRKWFADLLAAMLFVPLYLHAAGWLAAFGVQGWFTAEHPELAWLTGWRGAIWVHAMAAIPWVALIVGAGSRFVEAELEEQALLDSSALGVFGRVTLRRVLGSIGVAALWVLVSTAGEMTVTDFFQIRTYAEEVYINLYGPEPATVALGVLPSVLFTGCITLFALVLCARLAPRARESSVRTTVRFSLGNWKWPLLLLIVVAVTIVAAVPIANLIYKAGEVTARGDSGLLRSWSPAKCAKFIADGPLRYRREFGWSLFIASLAATAALAAAIPLGWFARRGGWRANIVLAMTATVLALPGPIIGVIVIWIMNRPEIPGLTWLYDRTVAAPWLALTLRAFPITLLVAWHSLRTVTDDILEAASSEGAGSLQRLWFVAVPQRRAALAAAWLVAFAVALGDLAASILTVPPGMKTLSIQVFEKLHFGQEDYVAGICLALLIVFGVMTWGIGWLLNRGLQKGA